jgi:thiol-disulfide isomerase/thioredoxin
VNAASPIANAPGYPPLASGLADADLELISGGTFKISERKGKALLLNIWGTWCGPCRAEMPHLIEMQDKYRDRGFEVIGLNIGDGGGGSESNEMITKFAEKMKLNYTLARSTNAQTGQFYLITKQSDIVPQSILVDAEGHLRGVFIGGGQRVVDLMKQNVARVMGDDPATVAPPAPVPPTGKQLPISDSPVGDSAGSEKIKPGKPAGNKK